ncbi:TPA: nitrogen fixation protein NifR [Staphylococcus aureus]|nr:nitrogen fixation protein NifR [Staphylococcus aureus]PZI26621.1 nitrogen fixation protein NifR [Staphylococcus aureus]PZJ61385.1 nitrogen fixation protein NifR [Staphylococcus aureus]PZK62433.1 nitrogen fixation protein NifR [Staphylococcus aureus]HAR7160427.1 nitrogen fixation protein NifR [Staphylococcus aureus]
MIVRGPNTEADEKSAYDNVQVGVWAPTKRNWNTNFYRQCKLGWGPNTENFKKEILQTMQVGGDPTQRISKKEILQAMQVGVAPT